MFKSQIRRFRRLSSRQRYWIAGGFLIYLGFSFVVNGSFVADGESNIPTVFASVGVGLVPVGILILLEPWLVENASNSAKETAPSTAETAVKEASLSSPTTVTVLCDGEPIVGAEVLALAANRTWKYAQVTSDGNAYLELHTTDQPLTVCAAAARYGAHVERGWIPAEHELTINLVEIPEGGSCVIREATGYVPGLSGRLNPILDDSDRTYIFADNITVSGGQPQPVIFTPGTDIDMEDANGNRFQVCVVHIIGRSSLIEYRRM